MTDDWPAPNAATAVIDTAGAVATGGPIDRPFPLASVTKLLTAWAVLIAVEEETLTLDAEVADLLAHASGLGPDGDRLAPPRTRRIYSNAGYEVLADMVEKGADMAFAEYLDAAVLAPLGMTSTKLEGSPAQAVTSTVQDLVFFAGELLAPKLIAPETADRATTVHLPELAGVLPGFGRQDPNPWGLGPEIRGDKSPHWTGRSNSASTFGHFGQTGTFLWVDPERELACVVLTDLEFGAWAARAWPVFSDAVLAAVP